MMPSAADNQDDDRLAEVLDEYLAALESGTAPSEAEFLAEHPELADQLRECLVSLQFLRHAGPAVGALKSPPLLLDSLGNSPAEVIAESANDPHRPGILGDYRLGREVGRGGMGVVYEAEQLSLSRRVAVKVLPFAAVLDGKQLRRFKNEAQLAAQLHHTNIVPVYAVGCERGVHFYAMQFIDGQTISDVIKDFRALRGVAAADDESEAQSDSARPVPGLWRVARPTANRRLTEPTEDDRTSCDGSSPPPAVQDATRSRGSGLSSSTVIAGITTDGSTQSKSYFRLVAQLGVQVAEALDHAHEVGVVHRDIKPSNLLLDQKGTVWVTDFGLAQVQTDLGLTITGDLVGTIRYMSPEQALAKRVPLDHRVDIYSLGVTLYELISLEPAFPGSNRHDVLRRIAFDDPPLLRHINKDIPVELETIVLKAIAKNPAGRYSTARELADDLQRFLQDRPILAKRPTLRDRATKLARRHQTVVRVAGVLLVILMLGSWISLLALTRQKAATDKALLDAREKKQLADARSEQADVQRIRAEKALARAETAERQQARELWRSYLATAKSGRRSRQVGQRFESLKAIAAAAVLVPQVRPNDDELLALRDEAIASLQLIDLHSEQQSIREIEKLGINHSLDLIAEASPPNSLVVRRLSDGAEVTRIGNVDQEVLGFQFTSDGRFLVGNTSFGEIRVWSLIAREEVFRTRFDPTVHTFVLSPSGQLLAVAAANGTTELFDIATGQRIQTLPTGFGAGLFAAFSPDSRRIAVATRDGMVRIWNVGTGELQHTIETRRHPMSVAWRPTGTALAIGTLEGHVLIRDLVGDRDIRTLTGHQGAVVQVSYHPRLDLLITNAWDGTARIWAPASGEELLLIPGWSWHRVSADGRRLLLADQRKVHIWRLELADECHLLAPYLTPNEILDTVEFTHDGGCLVLGAEDGLRFWDLASGSQFAQLPAIEGQRAQRHPVDGSLLMAGPQGIHRRACRFDDASNSLRLGTKEFLSATLSTGYKRSRLSPDGRWLASSVGLTQGFAMDLKQPWRRMLFEPHWGLHDVSVGEGFAVSSAFHGHGLPLNSLKTGALLRDLWPDAVRSSSSSEVSLDGRWLIATTGAEVRIFDTQTWDVVHTIAREGATDLTGPVAFSPDGQMVLVPKSRSKMLLLKTGQWTPLASLESPESAHIGMLNFSPDSSRVAAICSRVFVRVWDLSRLRQRLQTVGLDWGPSAAANKSGLLGEGLWGPLDSRLPRRESPQLDAVAAEPLKLAPLRSPLGVDLTTRWRDDIERLTQRLAEHPREAVTLLARGDRHLRLQNIPAVTDDFRIAAEAAGQVLATQLDDLAALQVRGQARERLNDNESALADLDRALTLAPDHIGCRIARARIRWATDQVASMADLTRAIELCDGDIGLAPVVSRSGLVSLPLSWAIARDHHEHELSEALLLRGRLFIATSRLTEAAADFDRTLTLRPNNAIACNERAWIDCIGPNTLRQPRRALELARRAVEQQPTRWTFWGTLGVAHYRNGDYEQAIPALMNGVILSHYEPTWQSSAFEWFFLAMSFHKLGEPQLAAQSYDRALQWLKSHPQLPGAWSHELMEIRAEADSLLGH